MIEQKERRFSLVRAVLHVAAVIGLILLLATGFAVTGRIGPEKLGEVVGKLLLPAIGLGLWWSWAAQLGRTAAKPWAVSFLVFMFAYEGLSLLTADRGAQALPPLTTAEQAQPEEHETSEGLVLCQRAIGLRVPVRGFTLKPAEDMKQTIAGLAPMDQFPRWPYRSDSGDIVVLMAARGFESEADLENFAIGVEKSSGGENSPSPPRRQVSWQGDHGDVTLTMSLANHVEMEMRCVTNSGGTLGCTQVVGRDLDRFRELLQGTSLRGCSQTGA